MARRNIGQEIDAGHTEIKGWRRGELKVRTFPDETLRATITLRNL